MYVVRLRPKKCISLFVANADFNWMENLCACDCTVCVLRYSTERVGECHKNTTTTERKNWMGEIEGTNEKKNEMYNKNDVTTYTPFPTITFSFGKESKHRGDQTIEWASKRLSGKKRDIKIFSIWYANTMCGVGDLSVSFAFRWYYIYWCIVYPCVFVSDSDWYPFVHDARAWITEPRTLHTQRDFPSMYTYIHTYNTDAIYVEFRLYCESKLHKGEHPSTVHILHFSNAVCFIFRLCTFHRFWVGWMRLCVCLFFFHFFASLFPFFHSLCSSYDDCNKRNQHINNNYLYSDLVISPYERIKLRVERLQRKSYIQKALYIEQYQRQCKLENRKTTGTSWKSIQSSNGTIYWLKQNSILSSELIQRVLFPPMLPNQPF